MKAQETEVTDTKAPKGKKAEDSVKKEKKKILVCTGFDADDRSSKGFSYVFSSSQQNDI